jgi:hypothetical protein
MPLIYTNATTSEDGLQSKEDKASFDVIKPAVTSVAAGVLLGRGTGSAGVMQEITIGTGLSLAGTTLNASGGGGAVPEKTTTDDTPTLIATTNCGDEGAYWLELRIAMCDHTNGGADVYYANVMIMSDGAGGITIFQDGFNQLGSGAFTVGSTDFSGCNLQVTNGGGGTVTVTVTGNANQIVWRIEDLTGSLIAAP